MLIYAALELTYIHIQSFIPKYYYFLWFLIFKSLVPLESLFFSQGCLLILSLSKHHWLARVASHMTFPGVHMQFARFCRWVLLYCVCNLQGLGAHSLSGFLFALYSFWQAGNGTRDSAASSHPSYIIIWHCDLEKSQNVTGAYWEP